jgi:hypothetical protein
MQQFDLFGNEIVEDENDYTKKIKIPLYLPKHRRPEVIELLDSSKTKRLFREIDAANVTDEEKEFLKQAATRHTVFNYTLIADYYSHASAEMQHQMERSALVIIDFDKAIMNGYVKLSEDLQNQYVKEYKDGK